MSLMFDWTFPNLGKYYCNNVPFRGSLKERGLDALSLNLNRIEIPFDLARKENNEAFELGLSVGDIITRNYFDKIFDATPLPRRVYFSVHTDPQLKSNHVLRWDDSNWRRNYIEAITDLCHWIKEKSNETMNAKIIEIHPGTSRTSSLYALRDSIIDLVESLQKEYPQILIVVENRTSKRNSERSVVGTVEDMLKLADLILREDETIITRFGFAADIQQLYTEYNRDIRKLELGILRILHYDPRLLKVFHIHTKHKAISEFDIIPWAFIARIVQFLYSRRINPRLLPEVQTIRGIMTTIVKFEKMALKGDVQGQMV